MLLYLAFALIGLASIGYTACGIAITRRFISRHVNESHNEVLVPIFLTGGTIYAVFLAFLVVSVWASHDGAHADVADEASGLATMYRASADPAGIAHPNPCCPHTRVLDSGESLSAVMWIAAIASGALVIAMTFFLYMRTQWLQILLASFLATMICMMLCITYMLSHPFAGPLAISSDAFKHSVFVYDNVDLGK